MNDIETLLENLRYSIAKLVSTSRVDRDDDIIYALETIQDALNLVNAKVESLRSPQRNSNEWNDIT